MTDAEDDRRRSPGHSLRPEEPVERALARFGESRMGVQIYVPSAAPSPQAVRRHLRAAIEKFLVLYPPS